MRGAFGLTLATAGFRPMHLAAAAQEDLRPLSEIAAAKGLLYGSCVDTPDLATDSRFADLVAHECGIVLSEGDMQWLFTEKREGKPDYSIPERLAAFAAFHEKKLRGHSLLWDQVAPSWFDAARGAAWVRQTVERRIAETAGRFAGRMHSWDVVNEIFSEKPTPAAPLRDTRFTQALGPEYLDLAFHAARKADPHTLLGINEFGLEDGGRWNIAKREAMLTLVTRLRGNGVPVTTVGLQSHLDAPATAFDEKSFAAFLADLAATGVTILLTELDVTDKGLPSDIPTRDRGVALAIERYLAVALDQPAVKAVISWGITDRYSWIAREQIPAAHHRRDGLPPRPVLYDAMLEPKPARDAVRRALISARSR